MSDPIRHNCGLAFLRLKRPLSYYRRKYGAPAWGLDILQLLMIKQRNRGQDGAGLGVVKFDMPMGHPYLQRERTADPDPTQALFGSIRRRLELQPPPDDDESDGDLKCRLDFLGELYVGHLRYGTFGEDGISSCHPYVRHSNWASRSLLVAGNFNLTNADQIFEKLVSYGLRPVGVSDTLTVLEKIGHFLDVENRRQFERITTDHPDIAGAALAAELESSIDLRRVLAAASKDWDGGYVFAGLIGCGIGFICRDPNGIRPAFYYENDEVVVAASERPAITTIFDVQPGEVHEVPPGHVLVVPRDISAGTRVEAFAEPAPHRHCTFERVYFSRGNDPDIYRERKRLGASLATPALDAVDWDFQHTVFSFIPNTAETAFLGLIEELEHLHRARAVEVIWQHAQQGMLTREAIEAALAHGPRVEKAAHKDQKLRTFISQAEARNSLVRHVYDITRETLNPGDSLVVLDDSIVRGTTLRDSIVTMLARLNPARLVVLSSAPPIRYPDCYGIDMSQLGRFVAFEAAVAIRRRRNQAALMEEVYRDCKAQENAPLGSHRNHVARIYDGISDAELSEMIAELIRPRSIPWQGELRIVYQTIDGLHNAMPRHTGDWYFTGNYPTPGGYKVLNTAYINYFENRLDARSYGGQSDSGYREQTA